ncbi:YcjF family protein [Desulfoplanes formicivorans]|uniref:GTPase n=1 Tax=Desulfoplanes formicivorans TaxID=1592317 RepID=A0A194AEW4_9BACT|nr:DUF697 domain-containing protein [Desulfoplanes formicivorans]GAU08612.1 GTPase [Desulfoplanes formicivorans]
MAKKKAETGNDALKEQPVENMAENTQDHEARVLPSEDEIDAIIRKRVYAAVGVGFVPVPLVDLAALTAVQLELIHALAKAYGVEFKKERAKSIISSLCGGVVSVASVPFFASLFKSLPVVGSTAGAATVCIVGGGVTYAIGSVFDRHFRHGGTLLDFDAQNAKSYFKTKVEEGKDIAAKMKPKKDDAAGEAATL